VGIREGSYEQKIVNAENGGVGGAGKCKYSDHYQAERFLLPQYAGCVAKIALQLCEPAKSSPVPMLFKNVVYPSQLDQCISARFFLTHARTPIVFDVHCQVALDFLGKFTILLLPLKQVA
jgi:hypothetical protein